MIRAVLLVTLLGVSSLAAGQELSVLHVKVVVTDAERKAIPVPRHALLVSDNPPSVAPEQIVTAVDGTVAVRLRPGNYIVESDQPLVFHGKSYQWTQMVKIVAGRDASLELTGENAEVELATAGASAGISLEADPSVLQRRWQQSVVALWTPSTHASGFLIDEKGLIATNQRVIGAATSVEVQLSPDVKVTATVLAADPVRDVAILLIDPRVSASLPAVPIGCSPSASSPIVSGQELYAIDAPLRVEKGMTSLTVSRVDPHAIVSDFRLDSGSAGGPVFTAAGSVVGITSLAEDKDDSRRVNARIVPIDDVCGVVASAEKKLRATAAPNATHLPVEPVRPFPESALKDAAQRRVADLSAYQMSTSDFDVAFVTPTLAYAARYQSEQARTRDGRGGVRTPDLDPAVVRLLIDFGNWSEYVADSPPVLLIRMTPKLVESFWTTVARGAARTQGAALPPIKHVKSGFSRLRLFCGDAEVTAIHPLRIEQRLSESEAINEGLYVFEPGAIGPQCGPVKLVLYSEKDPAKGDTRLVEPRLLEQIWHDFAPYREP